MLWKLVCGHLCSLVQTCAKNASYFIPVSTPSNPVKRGVSSNIFIILSCTSVGSLGGGLPPVFRICLLTVANVFFAELVTFFHFSYLACCPIWHSYRVYFFGYVIPNFVDSLSHLLTSTAARLSFPALCWSTCLFPSH